MNKKQVSVLAVLANVFLAASKMVIGLISKSSSVMAEGIHSATDILSSLLNLFGVNIANKPVDKEHPYGHYKFEVLSGLLITLLLFLTGVYILFKAYRNFLDPQLVELNYLAIIVMGSSAIINELMARLKITVGKKEKSISLISDGVHSRVDVIASLAVFVGLFLTPIFNHSDAILTLLIGLYIIKESFSLGKEATDSLLDVSAGEEIEDKIRSIVKANKITLSELKTQKKGSAITANLVIKLPKTLSVEEAAKISENLRKKLMKQITSLKYVAIQIDSHDLQTNFYRPSDSLMGLLSSDGFAWKKKGRYIKKVPQAKGLGPGGVCRCRRCGYETEHEKGLPCAKIDCPNCGMPLERG